MSDVRIDFEEREVRVVYDGDATDPRALAARLARAGFSPSALPPAPAPSTRNR